MHLTGILRAIFNKSCQQRPTRHQLYGHLPPITKTIQVRRTKHAGHCWRRRGELIRDVLLWTRTYGRQKQDDQLEHTYSNYVRIRDVALKTYQRRWTIGRSGERGSGISVLAARHDDDNDFTHWRNQNRLYRTVARRRVHILLVYIYIYSIGKLLKRTFHNVKDACKGCEPKVSFSSFNIFFCLSVTVDL